MSLTYEADYEGDETVDLCVSMALATLRKLMYEELIPVDVEYIDYADP